jgi:glycosyltransferase involved in cell wall biosynthesis
MRVAFDATTIRGNKTGVGYYSSRLLEHLTRVEGSDNPIDELLVVSNRDVDDPKLPRCRVVVNGKFPLRAIWMQTLLPLVLSRTRPDLCHFTNFLGPYVGRTPYVVTFHDMTLQLLPQYHTLRKRLLTRALSPAIARRARLIITPSESAKRDVADLLDIDRARIRAIPHAADTRFVPTLDSESRARIEARYGIRQPYLLYVGTLEPRKNLVRALSAFSRIAPSFPEHRFYLVGDLGWQSGELLRALEETPYKDRVRRLGYVSEDDLPPLYSNAELFVYPSLYEGFGFPVVEAMACGVPVLASETSSLREVAEGAAFLVSPTDTETLASTMERGLSDERERHRVKMAGFSRASSFSWERTTRETLAVYEEAVERGWPRGSRRPPGEPSGAQKAQAVLSTVRYGALFDYPMTLSEIHRTLMAVRLSRREIRKLLSSHRIVRERVEEDSPYYFVRGRGSSVGARRQAANRTRELLERERFAIGLLRRLPFVRMLALSGATAHENARDDDIDLLVVTAPRRTWAVALMALVTMKLIGRRGTICLNYLLGEDRLSLPERDVFTAAQIVGLKPIAGTSVFYRLVRANAWGERFFPNFWADLRSLVPLPESEPKIGSYLFEKISSFGLGSALERVGRFSLRRYWNRQLSHSDAGSSVKLEEGVIKLHFRDHGKELSTAIDSLIDFDPQAAPLDEAARSNVKDQRRVSSA